MATHSAILTIKVLTDATKAAQGMQQAATGVDKWKGRLSSAAKVATGVLVGLGAAAFAFGKAAAQDAQGAAVLANSLAKSTGATKAQTDAVEGWITKTELATGVADDSLRPALATLARATGSVTDSQTALSAALDISAATGKDVEAVSSAIAKGYAGNTSALGRLVPGIDKATLATGDMTKIMAELAQKTGGSAAAAADTAAGKMARMSVAMQETKESLGAALLPAMSTFATVAGKVAVIVGNNSQAFGVIAVVIGSVAAAIVLLNYALKAYEVILGVVRLAQAATWATALGPIALVIAAILGIVAVFVLLYRHSATFRAFVDATWREVQRGALALVAAVKPAFALLFKVITVYAKAWWAYLTFVFNAIKAAVKIVTAIFRGDWSGALAGVKALVGAFKTFFVSIFNLLPGPVRNALSTIGSIIGGAFRAAATVVRTVIGGIKTAISGIRTAITTAMRGVEAILTAPFNAAKTAVQGLIGYVEDLIGWISKIHIPDLGGLASHIPGLGSLAAPAGAPSALGVAARRDPSALGLAGRGLASATPGAGPTIIVQGALDPEAVARQIRGILAGHDRRVGLTPRAP